MRRASHAPLIYLRSGTEIAFSIGNLIEKEGFWDFERETSARRASHAPLIYLRSGTDFQKIAFLLRFSIAGAVFADFPSFARQTRTHTPIYPTVWPSG